MATDTLNVFKAKKIHGQSGRDGNGRFQKKSYADYLHDLWQAAEASFQQAHAFYCECQYRQEHPASIEAQRVIMQRACDRAAQAKAAYEAEKRREDPCCDEEPIDVVDTCPDCGQVIEDGRPGCNCCDPMPSIEDLYGMAI